MSETSNKTRLEHDCIGRMEVPANVYWGIHTQRAIGNFPVFRASPTRPTIPS